MGAGYAVLLNTDVLEPVANLSIEHVGDGQPILLRREQSTNVLTSDARPCWPDLCSRPIESIRIKRTISERTISYVTEDRGDGVGTYVEEYSEPTNTVEYDETLSVGHSVFDVPYRRWSDGCTNVVSRNVILYGSCVVAHSQPLRDFTVTIELPSAPTTETIAAIFDPVDCSPVATRLYVQVSIDGEFNESQSFHWSDERFIKTPMAWRYRCTQFTVNLAPVSCPTATQIESAFQSAITALAGTHPELAGAIVTVSQSELPLCEPTVSTTTNYPIDTCFQRNIVETLETRKYGYLFELTFNPLDPIQIAFNVWHYTHSIETRSWEGCIPSGGVIGGSLGCCFGYGTWSGVTTTTSTETGGWSQVYSASIPCDSDRLFHSGSAARFLYDFQTIDGLSRATRERRILNEIWVTFAESGELPARTVKGPASPSIGQYAIKFRCSDPFNAFAIDEDTGQVSVASLAGIETPATIPLTIYADSEAGITVHRTFAVSIDVTDPPLTSILPLGFVDVDLADNWVKSFPLAGTPVGIRWQSTNPDATVYELDDDAGSRFAVAADRSIVVTDEAISGSLLNCAAANSHNIVPAIYEPDGDPVESPPSIPIVVRNRWSMNPIVDINPAANEISSTSVGDIPLQAASEHQRLLFNALDIRSVALSIAGFTVTLDDEHVDPLDSFEEFSDWTFGDFTRRLVSSIAGGYRATATSRWRWNEICPNPSLPCDGFGVSTLVTPDATFRARGGLSYIPILPIAGFSRDARVYDPLGFYRTYRDDYGLFLNLGAITLRETNGAWRLSVPQFGFSLFRRRNEYANVDASLRIDDAWLEFQASHWSHQAFAPLDVAVTPANLFDAHSVSTAIPAIQWPSAIATDGTVTLSPATLTLQLVPR